MDMTSAPANAGTNPSTRKPSPKGPVIRLVSMNMSAFMTSTNRPSVARVSGNVNQTTTGQTTAFTTPKITHDEESHPMTGRIETITCPETNPRHDPRRNEQGRGANQ